MNSKKRRSREKTKIDTPDVKSTLTNNADKKTHVTSCRRLGLTRKRGTTTSSVVSPGSSNSPTTIPESKPDVEPTPSTSSEKALIENKPEEKPSASSRRKKNSLPLKRTFDEMENTEGKSTYVILSPSLKKRKLELVDIFNTENSLDSNVNKSVSPKKITDTEIKKAGSPCKKPTAFKVSLPFGPEVMYYTSPNMNISSPNRSKNNQNNSNLQKNENCEVSKRPKIKNKLNLKHTVKTDTDSELSDTNPKKHFCNRHKSKISVSSDTEPKNNNSATASDPYDNISDLSDNNSILLSEMKNLKKKKDPGKSEKSTTLTGADLENNSSNITIANIKNSIKKKLEKAKLSTDADLGKNICKLDTDLVEMKNSKKKKFEKAKLSTDEDLSQDICESNPDLGEMKNPKKKLENAKLSTDEDLNKNICKSNPDLAEMKNPKKEKLEKGTLSTDEDLGKSICKSNTDLAKMKNPNKKKLEKNPAQTINPESIELSEESSNMVLTELKNKKHMFEKTKMVAAVQLGSNVLTSNIQKTTEKKDFKTNVSCDTLSLNNDNEMPICDVEVKISDNVAKNENINLLEFNDHSDFTEKCLSKKRKADRKHNYNVKRGPGKISKKEKTKNTTRMNSEIEELSKINVRNTKKGTVKKTVKNNAKNKKPTRSACFTHITGDMYLTDADDSKTDVDNNLVHDSKEISSEEFIETKPIKKRKIRGSEQLHDVEDMIMCTVINRTTKEVKNIQQHEQTNIMSQNCKILEKDDQNKKSKKSRKTGKTNKNSKAKSNIVKQVVNDFNDDDFIQDLTPRTKSKLIIKNKEILESKAKQPRTLQKMDYSEFLSSEESSTEIQRVIKKTRSRALLKLPEPAIKKISYSSADSVDDLPLSVRGKSKDKKRKKCTEKVTKTQKKSVTKNCPKKVVNRTQEIINKVKERISITNLQNLDIEDSTTDTIIDKNHKEKLQINVDYSSDLDKLPIGQLHKKKLDLSQSTTRSETPSTIYSTPNYSPIQNTEAEKMLLAQDWNERLTILRKEAELNKVSDINKVIFPEFGHSINTTPTEYIIPNRNLSSAQSISLDVDLVSDKENSELDFNKDSISTYDLLSNRDLNSSSSNKLMSPEFDLASCNRTNSELDLTNSELELISNKQTLTDFDVLSVRDSVSKDITELNLSRHSNSALELVSNNAMTPSKFELMNKKNMTLEENELEDSDTHSSEDMASKLVEKGLQTKDFRRSEVEYVRDIIESSSDEEESLSPRRNSSDSLSLQTTSAANRKEENSTEKSKENSVQSLEDNRNKNEENYALDHCTTEEMCPLVEITAKQKSPREDQLRNLKMLEQKSKENNGLSSPRTRSNSRISVQLNKKPSLTIIDNLVPKIILHRVDEEKYHAKKKVRRNILVGDEKIYRVNNPQKKLINKSKHFKVTKKESITDNVVDDRLLRRKKKHSNKLEMNVDFKQTLNEKENNLVISSVRGSIDEDTYHKSVEMTPKSITSTVSDEFSTPQYSSEYQNDFSTSPSEEVYNDRTTLKEILNISDIIGAIPSKVSTVLSLELLERTSEDNNHTNEDGLAADVAPHKTPNKSKRKKSKSRISKSTLDNDSDDDFQAPKLYLPPKMINENKYYKSALKNKFDLLNKVENTRIGVNNVISSVHRGNCIEYIKSNDNDPIQKTTESDDQTEIITRNTSKSMIVENHSYGHIEKITSIFDSVIDDPESYIKAQEKLIVPRNISHQMKTDLLKQIQETEDRIKEKRALLDRLKVIEIYKKNHDVEKYRRETIQMRKSCQEALLELAAVVRQTSYTPFDMGTLLHNMHIPNEVVGYNPEIDEFI